MVMTGEVIEVCRFLRSHLAGSSRRSWPRPASGSAPGAPGWGLRCNGWVRASLTVDKKNRQQREERISESVVFSWLWRSSHLRYVDQNMIPILFHTINQHGAFELRWDKNQDGYVQNAELKPSKHPQTNESTSYGQTMTWTETMIFS